MHLERVVLHPETFPTRNRYPFNQEIFWQTPELLFSSPVTLFVGENGTGKSTLLEAICRRCDIHIWEEAERWRYEVNPYEMRLSEHIAVEWTDGSVPGSFFGSKVFQDFARLLDDWARADPGQLKHFGGKSLITQSHGQSLLSYFGARYRIPGLYLMDEPETALSPKSQIEMVRLLTSMARAGHAQFIVATHSPIMLACPGAQILSFDHTPIETVQYEQTEHYRPYSGFMRDPEAYLGDGQP